MKSISVKRVLLTLSLSVITAFGMMGAVYAAEINSNSLPSSVTVGHKEYTEYTYYNTKDTETVTNKTYDFKIPTVKKVKTYKINGKSVRFWIKAPGKKYHDGKSKVKAYTEDNLTTYKKQVDKIGKIGITYAKPSVKGYKLDKCTVTKTLVRASQESSSTKGKTNYKDGFSDVDDYKFDSPSVSKSVSGKKLTITYKIKHYMNSKQTSWTPVGKMDDNGKVEKLITSVKTYMKGKEYVVKLVYTKK